MPKPTTKAQLLLEMEQERRALDELLAPLSAAQLEQPDVVGHWSVKDVLAHLHEWIAMFLDWYAAGLRGEKPAVPAVGYNWGQLPQLNHAIYERYHDQALDTTRQMLADSYDCIRQLTENASEVELTTPGRYAWTGKHTLLTFIAANTSSHYRWARQEIRKGLKLGRSRS